MVRIARRLPAALIVFLLLAPTTAGAWVVTPEYGYGSSILLTPAGDLVTSGESAGPDLFDFSVRLQSAADGADLWHYQVDGSALDVPGSYNDFAGEVALDGAGNIVAGGQTRNTGTNADLHIVKLAPNGTPIWTRQLDSPTHVNDSFSDLALGPGGDVAVTGTFGIPLTFGPSYFFSIVRLAGSTGAPLWQHDIPGGYLSRGIAVGFDVAGNVLACGDAASTPGNSEVVAVKLDGTTGVELWRSVVNGGNATSDFDSATTAAIDAAGDFYVGAQASTTNGDGFTVYKFSGATGGLLWRYDHTPPGQYAFTILLRLDGADALYAGGYVDGNFALAKLSMATGVPIWTHRIHSDYYTSLAFDPAGDLLLGGAHGVKFALQKIRASDGHKRWRRTLRGNSYNGGFATDVAVDATGAVFATGGHVATLPKGQVNGPHSYTVVKACGRNGRLTRTDDCP